MNKEEGWHYTLYYLKLCGFNISDVNFDEENNTLYREITHTSHIGKIFKYTPKYIEEGYGVYGKVDMLPILKEDIEKVFGFKLPTTEELYYINQNKDE